MSSTQPTHRLAHNALMRVYNQFSAYPYYFCPEPRGVPIGGKAPEYSVAMQNAADLWREAALLVHYAMDMSFQVGKNWESFPDTEAYTAAVERLYNAFPTERKVAPDPEIVAIFADYAHELMCYVKFSKGFLWEVRVLERLVTSASDAAKTALWSGQYLEEEDKTDYLVRVQKGNSAV